MEHIEKKEHWIKSIIHFAGSSKVPLTLSVLLAIISVIGGMVPYVAIYQIITNLVDGTQNMQDIIFWIAIAMIGYLAQTLFHSISSYFSHRAAYNILEVIRLQLAERLIRAPLGHILNQPVGKIKNVIIDRVETLELPLAHIIPEGISNLLLPIGVFIYMLTIDYRLALASLVTVPIAFIVYAFMMRNFNTQYQQYMDASNHVNSVIVEYVEGIEVIKTFNQTNTSYEKFSNSITDFKNYTMKWFRSTWPWMTLGNAILPSTLVGTLPIGLWLYQRDAIDPPQLIICLILSMGLIYPLMKFTVFINDFKAIEYAIDDTKAYLNLESLPIVEETATLINYDIALNAISFSYDNQHHVIQNLSLTIPEKSYTALVGPSGSGKSTIAKLLARFWDVTDGTITIGGTNIKEIHPNDLSKHISFVAQDNFLFKTSLLENIRMGNPQASDEEVFRAARLARCDTFISRLDNGYDSDSGEAGNKLSGGEKQRIAIARAILKDAPIIILDEATAFTDPENEAEIQKAFNELAKDKTLIVIAHRLSTIRQADQIVVLKDGSIHQVGTHDDLLKGNELYLKLWKAHISSKEHGLLSEANLSQEVSSND
ncbi:ABC transporter ATP-binding protein [Lysinibacillus sphaericus]|uniref:Transport ATP-binding protein CydD n=1 Tax=Lysinibacillus sphaericus OT4b.31 TaxID=1285586 RepID=R7ZIC8_LYSSH|nr:ABC transporter ATP-binding protein [Lysinibacillus sphaericus]EON73872.1 transport ATP-binding protein CydD [Lysinibacillus sphaericus OT4b.31]